MASTITSIKQLEDCLGGAAPLGVKMKVIDHIDPMAAKWVDQSPIAFIGLAAEDGPRVCAAGGAPGFAAVDDDGTLILQRSAIDDAGVLEAGKGAGVLFLAPGVGETMRANGRVKAVSDTHVAFTIEECFVHCAKALIRSQFWTGRESDAPAEPGAFINATRFLALATMDSRIDISPKGDPAGLLVRLVDGRATLAERPGNKLAFGYRNIIEQPRVAALAIIPGVKTVATLAGRATLSNDEAVRGAFMVDGKTPILATIIEDVSVRLSTSRTLEAAAIWSGKLASADIDPAETFVAHVKLNKEQGVPATLLRLAVNRGLVDQGLKQNYKTQLY